MLWLASSVFNVDWSDPFGLRLVITVVVSVLATGGAAAALHHLGHDQRQNKNHDGHLKMVGLTIGSKMALVGVAALIVLVSTAAFYRVWAEGVLSGLADLALLLALLVAVVMLISAWLVFWTAFRDGSPEQTDLAYYSRLVRRHLTIQRRYRTDADQLEPQTGLNPTDPDTTVTRGYLDTITSAPHTTNGQHAVPTTDEKMAIEGGGGMSG